MPPSRTQLIAYVIMHAVSPKLVNFDVAHKPYLRLLGRHQTVPVDRELVKPGAVAFWMALVGDFRNQPQLFVGQWGNWLTPQLDPNSCSCLSLTSPDCVCAPSMHIDG